MTAVAPPVARRVPFSLVDELACYFDRPSEPNNIHLEMAVAGRLEEGRLQAAVTAALDSHPLANARRAPWRWYDRGFVWEMPATSDPLPLTIAVDPLTAARSAFLAAAPALAPVPPLRLCVVRRADGGDVLLLNAHHAAVDGLSCLRLMTSIAREYTGVSDPVPPGDPLRLRTPAAVPPGDAGRRGRLAGRPARIAGHTSRPGPGCGIETVDVPVPTGGRPAYTVNDLLVAAVSRAVATWNDEHDRPTGTVCVTMPVNGRPPGQRTEILGNLCRLTTVATTPAERADPRRLLAAVAAQTNAAKNGGGSPAGAMARVLGSPRLPVGVKSVLTAVATRLARRFVDTVIVSNLGRVVDAPRFDDAGPVTAVRFSLPARMPRGLSIGAVTHDGRLSLCFRYRYALFDGTAAGRFAAVCAAALAELADDALAARGRSR